jgi:DNA-binding NarL/FixJ family response regulator
MTLTPHQIRILQDVANGLSTGQMAIKYHVTDHCVTSHLRNVREALGVHSKPHAVAVAMREGLIT